MPDERFGRRSDALEVSPDFANRDRVRTCLVLERFDIDSRTDQQVRAVVLNARLDEDAGDFFSGDENIVRPLDPRVDGKYIMQICNDNICDREWNYGEIDRRAREQRRRVNALPGRRGPG